LDPVDFGIVAVGTIVIYYANSFTNFGFNNALVQRESINERQIDSVFTIDILISIVLTLITLIFAADIAAFFGIPESESVIKVLSSFFILTTFYQMPDTLLRKTIQFKQLSLIKIIQTLAGSILTLVMAIIGFKYWSLVLGNLLAYSLATGMLLYIVDWKPRINYSHSQMKDIYNFSFWNLFRGQVFYINKYLPQFFIGKYQGADPLGNFEKAYSISTMPQEGIGAAINSVMFSSFSRIQKDKSMLQSTFSRILTIEAVILFPLLLGLYAISPYFIIVVLGEKWHGAILPLQIFCLSGIFSGLDGVSASLNVAVGDYKGHTMRRAYSVLLLIILCTMFIRWGVLGICLAYLLSSIVRLIISMQLSFQHTGIVLKNTFFETSPYILANLIMLFVVMSAGKNIFPAFNIQNMMALIFIGAAVYCCCIFALNFMYHRNVFYPLVISPEHSKR